MTSGQSPAASPMIKFNPPCQVLLLRLCIIWLHNPLPGCLQAQPVPCNPPSPQTLGVQVGSWRSQKHKQLGPLVMVTAKVQVLLQTHHQLSLLLPPEAKAWTLSLHSAVT